MTLPLGYRTARSVIELGRAAFFGTAEADLPESRSPLLQADDRKPQFGFVGSNYPSVRVLLFGINPGNGPATGTRTAADARMMPALAEFAADPTPERFVAAQRAYRTECVTWPVWRRHCAEVIGAGKLSLDDIAYGNCLPWRTASNSAFSDAVAERAATLYARPLIAELQPKIVIALGKKAAEILRTTEGAPPDLIVWNRAQAATAAVIAERAATAAAIFARLGST